MKPTFLLTFQTGPTPPNSNPPPAGMDEGNYDSVVSDSKHRTNASSSQATSANSNGIAGSKAVAGAVGTLAHDQLAKMFPTPPDHRDIEATDAAMDLAHHPLSPGGPAAVTYLKSGELVLAGGVGMAGALSNGGDPQNAASVSGALLSLSLSDLMDWSSAEEDATVMYSSTAFLPLKNLSQPNVMSMMSGLGEKGKYVPRTHASSSSSSRLLHAALTGSTGQTQPGKWQSSQGYVFA